MERGPVWICSLMLVPPLQLVPWRHHPCGGREPAAALQGSCLPGPQQRVRDQPVHHRTEVSTEAASALLGRRAVRPAALSCRGQVASSKRYNLKAGRRGAPARTTGCEGWGWHAGLGWGRCAGISGDSERLCSHPSVGVRLGLPDPTRPPLWVQQRENPRQEEELPVGRFSCFIS